jgi:hypothetical protein
MIRRRQSCKLCENESRDDLGRDTEIYDFSPVLKGLAEVSVIDKSPFLRVRAVNLPLSDQERVMSTLEAYDA